MGTLKDEMTKILDQWDSEALKSSTVKENAMSTAPQETKKPTRGDLTKYILDIVHANPGITSMMLKEFMKKQNKERYLNQAASMLNQLSNSHHLSREVAPMRHLGREVFQHFVVSDDVRIKTVEEERARLKVMQARAEKARAAKAAKKAAKEVKAQVVEEAPKPLMRDPKPAPSAAAPYVVKLNAENILQNISILEARALYEALKEIFGK
jgi:formiminotetrahydrofolate cyclodeaminase